MKKSLKLVFVKGEYTDYLYQFDKKVPYNNGIKRDRPFIGVLFKIKEYNYFAPLFSPKPKHLKLRNTLDFEKIDGGRLGAINFNNMIPIPDNAYLEIDMVQNKLNLDVNYYNLLQNQYYYLLGHVDQIKGKGYKLYSLYKSGNLSENIKNRCCNFVLLEEKCMEYNNS